MGKKSEQKKGPQPPPEPIQEPSNPATPEIETQSHVKTGDKPKYRPLTPELFAEICELMAHGDSVPEACEKYLIRKSDFYYMAIDGTDEQRRIHARARKSQAMAWVDQVREIADDSSRDVRGLTKGGAPILDHEFTARSKLRIEVRQWWAERLLPTVFGRREEVTVQAGSSLQSLVQRLRGDGGAGSGALPVVEVGAEVATRSRAQLVEVAQ